mgnify:CR=1 FL=1
MARMDFDTGAYHRSIHGYTGSRKSQFGNKTLLAEDGRILNDGKVVFVSDLCNHFLNEFAFVGESSERFFVDICLENLLDFVHALVVEGNLIADGLKFFIQNFKCTGQRFSLRLISIGGS